jgi:hypothetical protein
MEVLVTEVLEVLVAEVQVTLETEELGGLTETTVAAGQLAAEAAVLELARGTLGNQIFNSL